MIWLVFIVIKKNMSLKIPIELLSSEAREKIIKDLTININSKKNTFQSKSYQPKSSFIEVYDINDTNTIISLPFAYCLNELVPMCNVPVSKPSYDQYKKICDDCTFIGSLREEQKSIKEEAITNLNQTGACLISAYPGFGKTCTSIYITSKIKLQTVIIINRIVLMNQWEEAIRKFCPNANIVCVKPNTPSKRQKQSDFSPDYIIVNAVNIPKIGQEMFKNVGVVIVDEAHLIMSQVLSQGLFYIFPKYIIGLSATPYRIDGLDALMTLYFTDKKIIRNLHRNHTVYRVDTGFTPEVEYDRNGKVIWSKILEQQCLNQQRNALILDIVQKHPTRFFLVLSKRTEQAQYLYDCLLERNENVSLLIGSNTTFNKEARVLIGTSSKIGVGFDHSKMDALILASDLEQYFIQYLGRVFRTEEVEPLIFDLVDNNNILKKHFATRRSVYTQAGGKIVKYSI